MVFFSFRPSLLAFAGGISTQLPALVKKIKEEKEKRREAKEEKKKSRRSLIFNWLTVLSVRPRLAFLLVYLSAHPEPGAGFPQETHTWLPLVEQCACLKLPARDWRRARTGGRGLARAAGQCEAGAGPRRLVARVRRWLRSIRLC